MTLSTNSLFQRRRRQRRQATVVVVVVMLLTSLLLFDWIQSTHAFNVSHQQQQHYWQTLSLTSSSRRRQRRYVHLDTAIGASAGAGASSDESSVGGGDYSRRSKDQSLKEEEEEELSSNKKQWLYPKVGDVVRYYQVDGGQAQGQVLVGKIVFIQQRQLAKDDDDDDDTNNNNNNNNNKKKQWLVEVMELDNVGDGYYADYPSRSRRSKKTWVSLEAVSPIAASYVQSEGAFKVPRTMEGLPAVRAEHYNLQDYAGPVYNVNTDIVQQDGQAYGQLKVQLIRNAAIAGLVGTMVTNLSMGLSDAMIYAAGAMAGVGYLVLLSIKTDTVASPNAKLGNNVSNLRFVLPILVVASVALYNKSTLGDITTTTTTIVALRESSTNPFQSITAEQFAFAMIGFLTYRIPLVIGQLKEALFLDDRGEKIEELTLPGSAGIAMKMVQGGTSSSTTTKAQESSSSSRSSSSASSTTNQDGLVPILLVSGPKAAGRSTLVQQLIDDSDGRFVEPSRVDAIQNGATFERLQQRDEFLYVDPTGRYGITKDNILHASNDSSSVVVVVDADVDLARKLTKMSGVRLIAVWVGLDSVEKFETRLKDQVDKGEIIIPDDETKDSVIRAKVREIVKDIEYGVVSGIFEFTILNDNPEESIKELKAAAQYCFT